MKIGTITISAAIIGAIWGAIWMIVIGILLMLVSGITASPPAGTALVAGLAAGLAFIFLPIEKRTRTTFTILGVGIAVLLFLLTGGQVFGTTISEGILYQILAWAIWSALVVISIKMCLQDYQTGSAKRYRMELLLIRVLKGLAFVLFTIVVILPFYVMVMTSLKSQQSLLSNPLDFSINLAQGPELLFRSYIELFTQYHFGTFLWNSALVSVATVVITLLFAVPGAYAVARLRFPGQVVLSRSILLIYMVPAIVLVIPLYAVFSQAGLRNSLTGLLIVYPATTIPVALYMLQGYFRGLPSELEEAGLMDGLSRVGVIAKITMPLSLPALASVALYVFMIAWNEFLFAFMFLDDLDMFTLSRGVVSLNSSEVPRQHLMAGAVVATVPVLAIFLWFEKFLVAGLTAGSVKG